MKRVQMCAGCGRTVYLYVSPTGWTAWVHRHSNGLTCHPQEKGR